jgi:anti-anti-sigma factor
MIELRVSAEDVSGVRVIRIVGPVDHAQYYKLEEAIQTQLDRKQMSLVVDLSELTYISSAGINALGHAVAQYETLKGRLCYVRPANTAQWHFFATVGVDQMFPWAASLDEAITRVSAA